jgi:MYXO-CTERM domain-containing protein
MMNLFFCLLAQEPPGPPLIGNNLVFYSVFGGVLLLLLLSLLLWLRRRRRPAIDPEASLIENLGDYPPAGPGPQRLFFHGQPLRLRLVVLAPLGKRALPSDGAVEPLLERVLYGLGDIVRQDRPRIRIWPPQLSQQGFAPTFFRLTRRPEPAGKASPWVLVAGPVRTGGHQFVLGMALCSDEPTERGNISLQADQWNWAFRIGPRR